MSTHRRLPKGLALALLALAASMPAAAQDDTALFSASVPPNVLMVVDTSGSMNEIMYHPNFKSSDATCAMFGWEAPGLNPPTTSLPISANNQLMNDSPPAPALPKGTRYTCDPNTRHCRFTISEKSDGFVSTGTVTCQSPPSNNKCGSGGESSPLASGQTQCHSGYITRTFCGKQRRLYIDGETACKNNPTWWSEPYLEWYFSPAADAYIGGLAEGNTSTDTNLIDADQNGTYYIDGAHFPLYKRTRITSAKEVARDVLFRVNTNCGPGIGNRATLFCPDGDKDAVRFGIAKFDGSNGGYVRAGLDAYSVNKATLDNVIDNFDADDSTPLAETLFKTYTYFMSRVDADRPFGADGSTRFPKYQYSAADGSNTSSPPPDPLDCDATTPGSQPCSCQKNFVIVITDGQPNNDRFEGDGQGATTTRTASFSNFTNLIGDYAPDPATDPPGIGNPETGSILGGNGYLYLDDVAKFMHDKDFRLDLSNANGDQTIDVYTVGFEIPSGAENLLQRTADNGNGEFFKARTAGEIADALVKAIQSIELKSQSFTAATVPATRTAFGGKFYNSIFVPSRDDGYWEGHLQSWTITSGGEILDRTGACAFNGNPTPCLEGTFNPAATPWWDAADAVPLPGVRKLYTSHLVGLGTSQRLDFDQLSIDESLLGVTMAEAGLYTYKLPAVPPLNVGQLADMVVANVAGCQFGTGALIPCVLRTDRLGNPHRLGDIFHSNPVVVGRPLGSLAEPSYQAFASDPDVAGREQVIVAGANDGLFRIFDAGTWGDPDGPGPLPAGYSAGDGRELAGFAPYTARKNLKYLARDGGTRDWYFTDGSPVVADVWLYSDPAVSAPDQKAASQWHTLAVSGMRQGGNQYFALDITNPADIANYPGYMWEFPREDALASVTQWMGQTWSEPIITRVKVAYGGVPQERWVAVFGGGYDPKGDPNSPFYDLHATAGRSITMLDLKTGEILAQKTFVDTTPAAATDPGVITYDPANPEESMAFAIPSTPGVYDIDFDGFADVIYVGDLGGNLWKWVVHPVGDDTVNPGSADKSQPNWPFEKFFAAQVYDSGTSKHYRSFFFNPSATLKSGVLWLAIASGERANLSYPGDPAADDENRFYALKDLDPFAKEPTAQSPKPISDDASVDPTPVPPLDITSVGTSCSGSTVGTDGYYYEGAEGEKWVTSTDIFFYYVFAATFTPQTATDPCAAAGKATLYAFKLYCGEGLFEDASGNPVTTIDLGDGMPTDPKVSLSGDEGGSRVFINKKDEVLSKDTGFDLDQETGQAYWRELH